MSLGVWMGGFGIVGEWVIDFLIGWVGGGGGKCVEHTLTYIDGKQCQVIQWQCHAV